jgi:hypothetical protein
VDDGGGDVGDAVEPGRRVRGCRGPTAWARWAALGPGPACVVVTAAGVPVLADAGRLPVAGAWGRGGSERVGDGAAVTRAEVGWGAGPTSFPAK